MSKFAAIKKRYLEPFLAGHQPYVCGRLLTGQKRGCYYDSPDCESSGRFASIEKARILGAFKNEKNTVLDSPVFGKKLKLLFRSIGENQCRDLHDEVSA